jgi:Fe-S cluster assembly scaffold protein SufB
VYSVITALPDRDSYWVIEVESPRRRSDDRSMNLEFLKTRVFFNLTEAKKMRDDLVIFGVVFLVTQNLPLTTLLGAAKKLKDTVKVLSEDETEVVRTIMGIAAPASAYSVGVPEHQVRAAYNNASVDVDQLLDSLQAKNIIRTERVGKLRLIL